MKKILVLFIILAAIVSTLAYLFFETHSKSTDTLVLYGNVDVRQVDLGFRVSGRVQSLVYEEGDVIPKGALIATLDKQPYEDLVKQSSAGLESSTATLKNAEQLLKRRQELVSDGSIAQEDLENALTNRQVSIANKMQAEAALAVAEINLNFTELYAPSEGTILTRIREPGSVVNPGESVYTLTISNPVWVRAYVNEQELGLVYPGMPAEIQTDTKGERIYHGRVGFISPTAEFTPKTVETTQLRTDLVYRLRIYAENPDRGLRQGMPVTVKLKLKKEKG